jgi:DHA1 family tetracycline resistance protein-like MFS transporter
MRQLSQRRDIRGLVLVYALLMFAQAVMQTTWVLYTHFRFNWGPRDNGIALFCVGVSAVVVQAGLLGWMIRKLGERKVAMLGIASGATIFLLYGLATQGWMMYALILCNLLSFASGPALQSIMSKSAGASEQGTLMGALQSISSLGIVIMPVVGSLILGEVSRLPAGDWRAGGSFFVGAAMQALACLIAWSYFKVRVTEGGDSGNSGAK